MYATASTMNRIVRYRHDMTNENEEWKEKGKREGAKEDRGGGGIG